MSSKYTANQIADWFLCNMDLESGESISHLKLQKIIYYAQAWSLTLLNKPLFDEDIEAWTHGPVIPSVYKRFRESRWEALSVPASCPDIIEENIESLLKEISSVYGKFNAKHLENLTHRDGPWSDTRGDLPPEKASSRPIPKELMQEYYRSVYEKATCKTSL